MSIKSFVGSSLLAIMLLAMVVVPAFADAAPTAGIDSVQRTLCASFNANPACGWAPLCVKLKGDTNVPCNPTYLWCIAGYLPQSSGKDNTLKQTFNMGGLYPTTLTTSNNKGQSACSPVKCVKVDCAVFLWCPDTCPKTIDFKYLGTPADKYCWDFGDGCKLKTCETCVKHEYKKCGTYIATVVAKNCDGNGAASSKVCVINQPAAH
jgi:PKD repeat protein